ncbi:MAG: hypothetical protein COV29_01485 [Candidatus Yanofskybacteria bacterium CG10_big_fil_rev_8_21_14_0_10_36_16]|uniref:Ada DNA repair metal-binding domain-containing protein n=1 Tax=Candidatus Yanofskybacteria bacterium CG10_big_fil_rev_8_21_14_0_10_36_16 TaxID=1975096 RepID=A0A2J0Q779_9BACT|nr:MAG: hypothetical protein COV29_01485 [Candidatus Yanofskybacteria bacterium CG10_big_fil_rev_8_21_14_0_10_36_16]
MKFMNFIKTYQRDVVFAVILALVFVSGYNIGKIKGAGEEKPDLTVTAPRPNLPEADLSGQASKVEGLEIGSPSLPSTTPIDFNNIQVVVSKNSDRYHFPWCPSMAKIKEENKIFFKNETEAQKAGYVLAGNCTK